jgi:hypothetical protein
MTLTEQYNNDTMIRNYDRFYDPGHSWLEVPIKDVRTSGTYTKITHYSPIKNDKIYLEEDCDLYTVVSALQNKGYTVNITNINVDDFDTWLKNQ